MAGTAFLTEIIVRLPASHDHEKEAVSKHINESEQQYGRHLLDSINDEFGFVPDITVNGEPLNTNSHESHVTIPKYTQP